MADLEKYLAAQVLIFDGASWNILYYGMGWLLILAGMASLDWRRAAYFGALAAMIFAAANKWSDNRTFPPTFGTLIFRASAGCLGHLIRRIVDGTAALAGRLFAAVFKRAPGTIAKETADSTTRGHG